jgi:hypothetical protein
MNKIKCQTKVLYQAEYPLKMREILFQAKKTKTKNNSPPKIQGTCHHYTCLPKSAKLNPSSYDESFLITV